MTTQRPSSAVTPHSGPIQVFERAISLFSMFSLLALPASTNYSLRGFGFGAGGTDDSASSNYRLNAISGEVSDTTIGGTTFDLGAGLNYVQQAAVPPAPALTNDNNYYNKLNLVLDNGGNPSDTLFAVAISTDAFATETKYVQNDNTVGDTLGSEDYQTYANWGGATGEFVIGLSADTTYTVKVKAIHGDFTETDFGPTDDATTSTPLLSFDIDVASTDTETSAPFAVDLGSLTAGTITDSTDRVWIDITTNGAHGARVYVVGDNAGLASALTAHTIDSISGDLSAASEGFGAQGASATETSGGPLAISSTYNVSSTNVGIIDTSVREIFETSNAITGGRGSFILKAKSSAVTPAASDYTEIITLLAAATF